MARSFQPDTRNENSLSRSSFSRCPNELFSSQRPQTGLADSESELSDLDDGDFSNNGTVRSGDVGPSENTALRESGVAGDASLSSSKFLTQSGNKTNSEPPKSTRLGIKVERHLPRKAKENAESTKRHAPKRLRFSETNPKPTLKAGSVPDNTPEAHNKRPTLPELFTEHVEKIKQLKRKQKRDAQAKVRVRDLVSALKEKLEDASSELERKQETIVQVESRLWSMNVQLKAVQKMNLQLEAKLCDKFHQIVAQGQRMKEIEQKQAEKDSLWDAKLQDMVNQIEAQKQKIDHSATIVGENIRQRQLERAIAQSECKMTSKLANIFSGIGLDTTDLGGKLQEEADRAAEQESESESAL